MKILFTTTIRPFGVVNDYSTKETNFEALASNFGRGQGIWVPRGLINEPSTHFIAYNIKADSTVLDHPTMDELLSELKKGYDYLAINFITPYYPRLKIMIKEIKKKFPKQKIIIGGYGVNTPGVEMLDVDHICKEEGVKFFVGKIGVEKRFERLKNPVLPCHDDLKLFGFFPVSLLLNNYYFSTGLGCPFGCEFCATSNFWGKRYRPLLNTGKELYEDFKRVSDAAKSYPMFMINQDDFLSNKERNLELLRLNRENGSVFFMFCFTSAFAISQFSPEDLVELGMDTMLIGIETNFPEDGEDKVFNKAKQTDSKTKKKIDLHNMIDNLADHGIGVVGAYILNAPQHNKRNLTEDVLDHFDMNVMASQFSTLTPYPGTPLFSKIDKDNKLIYNYHDKDFDENNWKYYDGMELVYKKDQYSKEDAKKMLELVAKKEFQIKGPSLFRMLKIQFNGYKKFKDSKKPILKKKSKIWKKRVSITLPLLYAAIRYDDIEIEKEVQEKLKGFLDEIEKEIRKVTIFDKICAYFLRKIMLRYKKKYDREDFVTPQRMKKTRYKNI